LKDKEITRMKTKILMANYQGRCDVYGNAVGHSLKVLIEYASLLQERYSIHSATSPCLAKTIKNDAIDKNIILSYDIVHKDKMSILHRSLNKVKEVININQVFRIKDVDVIWFYIVDYYLFLYLFFIRVKKKRMVCLLYVQNYSFGRFHKIKDYIFRKALLRFDHIIYTHRKLTFPEMPTTYMPDYFYDENKYGLFRQSEKKEKVVCLGTMGYRKKLEELVKIFNAIGYPLEIIGCFYQKKRLDKLIEMASPNIVISNTILDEDKYYCTLASAKYAILPYDMDEYKNRTSGVLQECMFIGVIPIAPKELLHGNGIEGIGYRQIDELMNYDFEMDNYQIIAMNEDTVKRDYDLSHIKEKIEKVFAKKEV
jgi:glycosyltransferase involved in cell wall biosynthesis